MSGREPELGESGQMTTTHIDDAVNDLRYWLAAGVMHKLGDMRTGDVARILTATAEALHARGFHGPKSGQRVRVGFRVIDETPGHATVQLWIGRNVGARGNSGQIVIRRDELEELEALGHWDRVE